MGIRIPGGPSVLGLLVLALLGGPAGAETLGEVLAARGVPSPPPRLVPVDQPIETCQVLDDERDLVVAYVAKPPVGRILRIVRFERATGRWTAAAPRWRAPEPDAMPSTWCLSGVAIERYSDGFLLRSHINPSAECTVVLSPTLSVRAVLAGWPMAALADGRIVYQRNQVHFAPFHPLALALLDTRRPGEVSLYPPRPVREIRRAHVDRLRAVYEHLSSRVVADAGGDTLAFVAAWDNTVGWSDTERWGRLEPFRELRAALSAWDGAGAPPDPLFRGLAAGLARARNLAAGPHVTIALAAEPALRDLVGAALSTPRAEGRDDRAWLLGLDPRWGEGATWRDLARAVAVPDEHTEVVYVYSGLRRPETMQYRELLRSDFEARFGPGLPERALDPEVLRAIFRPAVN